MAVWLRSDSDIGWTSSRTDWPALDDIHTGCLPGIDVINWIEKWLTHRRQRVIVDGEISNWKSVLRGVPQGSVLGPILFLIYINDLEDDITSKVLKFADDTKVFRKVTNDTDKQSLQDDLEKLVKWSEKWQMLLNFGKCKCIHIGHGNMYEEYKMGDAVLGKNHTRKGFRSNI